MSLSGSIGSPSKDCSNGSNESLPRDFSRLSLFSAGSTVSQDEHFQCEGHADHSLACMKKYLQAGKLCDVTLIAGNGGRKVQAHKLVLSAASEYFAAMFTGGLSNNEQSEITLGNVNGDVLQAVINYCYSGSIEIREDNVETLLATSCLMLLSEVSDACARFLSRQLHPSNCLGIAAFAEHQACSALARDAQAYTSQHFMQVVKNTEFLQLTSEQLASLLKSDDLNVPREEYVFRALMAWVQHDPSSRRQHVAHLLSLVKLSCLRPQYLCDQVEPAVSNDPACQRLVIDAMKWHLLPERHAQMAGIRTRPRKATLGRLLIVGGMDLNKGATTIESYCPRGDIWNIAHHMSGRRLQFGIALLQDKLLIVGGRDGLKTLNTMECLDLENGTWTQLSSMNTHRHGLGVAVLGGTLYAVGGHDGWSYLNTVERWDPSARQWHYVAPMLNQRCSAGVAVLNNRLYAIGGRDGAACLRSVERYDPHTNKWTLVASLSRRNGCMGVASCNGYLYVLGGQDAPANNPSASRFDAVDRYDPVSDTWSTVGQLPSRRDALAASLFGDKIYAIGGYDGSSYLRNVDAFDPVANEWVSLAPLRAGRAGACAIAVGNHILGKCAE